MNKIILMLSLVTINLVLASSSLAAGKGGWGLSAGIGVPYLSQAGVNYQMSDKFGLYLGYNLLDVTAGTAKATLSMPELTFNYHPFAGSFFVGLGVGQENLKTTATDALSGNQASIEVSAMTMLAKLGWMWGISDGGFWFGIDMAYIKPSSPQQTITAPGVPTTNQAYLDAVDAAEKFGNTAYTNITFARLGYIF